VGSGEIFNCKFSICIPNVYTEDNDKYKKGEKKRKEVRARILCQPGSTTSSQPDFAVKAGGAFSMKPRIMTNIKKGRKKEKK
jgi:hypothetical protein